MDVNIEKIREFANQYQKFIESNKKLTEMITTKGIDKEWSDNFHLIDHDWLIKWKDKISYDKLIQNKHIDYSNICKYIEKNIKNINVDKLDNKQIYYDSDNLDKVDPMKSFDIITDEVWRLFDSKDENLKYNGKVSILKGNRKIIISYDDNNYSVKYKTNDNKNLFGEFVIKFKNQKKEDKKVILNELSKSNIYNWMEEVDFKTHTQHFTINKYKIPFDIIQKTNNYYYSYNKSFNISFDISRDVVDDLNNNVSFSKCSFSFASISINNSSDFSFFNSEEFFIFFSIINNYRFIQKCNKTTNICSVMRCLSFIEPFAEYFMSNRKNMIVFSHFAKLSLLNLIRDFFLNLWSDEKSPFIPYEFTKHIKEKTKININVEQDPFIFLNFIISYIKRRLKYVDRDSNFNFYNIQDKIKESLGDITFSNELNKIIKENNTIASKCFDGLMLEIYNCEKCKQNFEIINIFNIITIDYRKIINFLHNDEGNSFASLDIDDFLEYFFLRKRYNDDNLQSYNCPNCKTESKIIKKEILEYPQYLIIRLKEGKFEGDEGFKIQDDIPNIKIFYKKIKYMRVYQSNKIESYKRNIQYNLISMINYLFYENQIRFISICKLIYEFEKKSWISFSCGSPPEELKGGYGNSRSYPYILFYQLQN